MLCHKCGETLIEQAIFCPNCGAKVNEEHLEPVDNTSETSKGSIDKTAPSNESTPSISPSVQATEKIQQPKPLKKQNTNKISTFKSKLPIIIPIVSFLVVSAILVLYYFNEQNKNNTVLELQKIAEDAALEGEYSEAIEALNEALDIRPDYEVLTSNLEETRRAQAFSNQLDAVHGLITNEEFDKAEEDLSTLKEQANAEAGPLFETFDESITTNETAITVGKIKQEIDTLVSVDALANRLSTLETLSSSAEVDDIKIQILNKIAQITNDEATEQLANNHLEEALNTVNKGLNYITDDEQLLDLKEQIEQEKIAYEEAQEQSAEEELHNRTAAVEVTSFTAELHENGDVSFEGTLISTATIPIYSLTAFYAVYDVNGQYLFDGFVYVDPYTLEPGDEGYFSGLIEAVNLEVTVEIYNITWYFDE